MTSTAVLLVLPPELIESIVIVANSPKVLAAVARTCRFLYILIYHSPDSHLWRALFLATWDDPRPALSHVALVDPRAGEREDQWDWGIEYRRRVQSERLLTKWRKGVYVAGTEDTSGVTVAGNTDLLLILGVLRSTLETLMPFPASPPIALTVLTPDISPYPTGNVGSGVGERRERMTSAPPLPPLLLLLASGFADLRESKSARRVGRIAYGPHSIKSDPSVATPCLPPQLTRTLLPSLAIGVRGFAPHIPTLTAAENWENSELADIFHRIVCVTGFVPIPPPLTSLPGEGPFSSFPSPAAQYNDARALARRRVYDMRYLMASRMWGPYHVVKRPDSTIGSQSTRGRTNKRKGTYGFRGDGGLGTLGWALGMNVEIDEEVEDDDEDDEDWHDAEDQHSPGSSQPQGAGNNDDEDTDEDDEEDEREHPLISLILTPPTSASSSGSRSRRSARSQTTGVDNDGPFQIKPYHLRPDYTYLASVRIVMEANLRELFGGGDSAVWGAEHLEGNGTEDLFGDDLGGGDIFAPVENEGARKQEAMSTGTRTFELQDILAKFRTLEVARIGGTCGYWSNWIGRIPSMPRARWSSGKEDKMNPQARNVEGTGKGNAEDEYKGKGKARADDPDVEMKEESNPALLHDWIDLDAPEGEEVEGWDWAGAAGIWRRCVCWMDYRELLFFNLDHTKFLTIDTQEACRTIPMEVRIEKYTRAGIMPVSDWDPVPSFTPNSTSESDQRNTDPVEEGSSKAKNKHQPAPSRTRYFRPPPVIHFVGASIGSDRSLDDGRTVRGTVSVIGGGEIRWTLDTYPATQLSFVPYTNKPEWSSEAIQIGGPGSAAGLLGMWTGASHERADPLGPFWAWKVA